MKNTGLTVLLYGSSIVVLVLIMSAIFSFNEQSLLQFDALHYLTIKNKGYGGIEVAFFPLFPFIWKFLAATPLVISIINAIVYFLSAVLLFRFFDFSVKEKILCLLTPGLVFFLVPYSEAFFFLVASLLLVGVGMKKWPLIIFSLLLCTLSRPSFTVLLPALVLMEFFSSNPVGRWKRMMSYVVVSGIGIVIVGVMQYIDTGRWFEFFSVQSEWDNALRIPTLPLRSWSTLNIVMLDGVALLIGGISGLVFLIALIKKKAGEMPDILKLSLAYLGGMSLLVLLFRGGSLFSLNRFLFCSPFFFIVIQAFWRSKIRYSTKVIAIIFVALLCYWLLFGSYVHIQTFLKYGALALFCTLFILVKHTSEVISKLSFYLMIFGLFFIQLFFVYTYLNGSWVG